MSRNSTVRSVRFKQIIPNLSLFCLPGRALFPPDSGCHRLWLFLEMVKHGGVVVEICWTLQASRSQGRPSWAAAAAQARRRSIPRRDLSWAACFPWSIRLFAVGPCQNVKEKQIKCRGCVTKAEPRRQREQRLCRKNEVTVKRGVYCLIDNCINAPPPTMMLKVTPLILMSDN